MDDNNWDIGSIVRNCNVNRPSNVEVPNLGSEPSNFENNDRKFLDRLSDVDIYDYGYSNEIYPMDFSVAYQGKPDDQYSHIIHPTTHVPIIADQFKIMDQNDNQQLYLQLNQPAHLSQQFFLPPSPPSALLECVPAAAATATSQEYIDLQQQLMMWDNVHPTFNLTKRIPLIQTHKKKNQPIQIIYELLQEELTDNIWTWRKIGQKSIRGSPYLRNYYKCNTSNMCPAKKQIEKSQTNDNFFLVAYSGVHNHDPPMKHYSFVGSNYSSKDELPKGINIFPKALNLNASSSLYKRAKRSRATPTLEIESIFPTKKKMAVSVTKNKGGGEEENMNEDILMGFEELNEVDIFT